MIKIKKSNPFASLKKTVEEEKNPEIIKITDKIYNKKTTPVIRMVF